MEDGSDHEHHVCVGSHIFFVTSSDVAINLSPLSGGILWLSDTTDLTAQVIIASRNSVGIGPRYQLTPRELRAHICVYCI